MGYISALTYYLLLLLIIMNMYYRASERGRAGADRIPVRETELQPADSTRAESQPDARCRLRNGSHPDH